jgi:hypothetical protein
MEFATFAHHTPPHHQAQIISLRTIMRAESPPHTVRLTNANLQFALATTTGVRRYTFYSTAGTQFTIDCDMQGVTDTALTNICIAIDSIDGQLTTIALDWAIIGWMLLLVSALAGLAWMIATPAHPWRIVPLLAISITLLWSFPFAMYIICATTRVWHRVYGIGAVEHPALGKRRLATNRQDRQCYSILHSKG